MLHGFKTATQQPHVNGDDLPGDPLDRDTVRLQLKVVEDLREAIGTGDLAAIEATARHFVNLRSLGRQRRSFSGKAAA